MIDVTLCRYNLKALDNNKVKLDFLGKDSMRHLQTIDLGKRYGDIGVHIYNNLERFCKKKK